jgi:hypothetical protein
LDAALAFDRPSFRTRDSEALIRRCQEIAKTPHDNVQEIASLLQQMIVHYYQDVRQQTQWAFAIAVALEVIAVLFFFGSAAIAMRGSVETAAFTAASGLLIQIMTGIVFYLYSQSAKQFGGFHVCLERTNRFLLANAMADHLPEAECAAKRAEVISTVLNAPMLTLGIIEKGV